MMTTQSDPKIGAIRGIKQAYSEHQDLLILALTGRTGSGCTSAAKLLSQEKFDVTMCEKVPQQDAEARKHKIIKNFLERNWISFLPITVSSVFLTYLVDHSDQELRDFNARLAADRRLSDDQSEKFIKLIKKARKEIGGLMRLIKASGPKFKSHNWTLESNVIDLITKSLPALQKEIGECLDDKYSLFFQEIGDNIRRSGTACNKEIIQNRLFSLPERLVRIIECIRERHKALRNHDNPQYTRIVIDAIRNPLELVFLRDRYATLFAVAITTSEENRKSRLTGIGYRTDIIKTLDEREYPEKRDSLGSFDAIATQDIRGCLEKSDIFINNPGEHSESKSKTNSQYIDLYYQLVKYIALALRPGIVTPTRDERCMQAAFVAKANSGCISRQVGAVVTDHDFAIRAMGWNDVPREGLNYPASRPCQPANVTSRLS